MSRSRAVCLIWVAVLVQFVPGTWAQMTAVTNSTSTPIPGAGHDYIKMLSETVDPANGSLSLRLQVPVPPARGLSIPFSFAYDSNGVHFPVPNSATQGTAGWDTVRDTTGGSSVAYAGWSYSIPMLSYVSLSHTTQAGELTCTYTATGGFVFTDASGGRHSLNIGHAYSAPNGCSLDPYTEHDTFTDPYYQVELPGGFSPVVVGADGTVYKFNASGYGGSGIVAWRKSHFY